MLGLLVGTGVSVVVVLMSWNAYRRVADPEECEIIQALMKSGEGALRSPKMASRPAMLLEELALVRGSADQQVAAFNDALTDVDLSTRSGLVASKSMTRVAFMAGMAGATWEIATHSGSAGQAIVSAVGALAAGVGGAAVCTVIGQRAIGALSRRRQLWDDFVRWILNSQFQETEFNVPGVHPTDMSEGRARGTQAQ